MYYYGMTYRPAGIGCQPMEGLIAILDPETEAFYDVVAYNRRLTDEEINAYELEFIGMEYME